MQFDPRHVLDSIGDGLYVTDLDRCIIYWNAAAERITGWSADEVVGRRCLDNILCHVDKDEHQLCGEEYCPLHRSMVTGSRSPQEVMVFAQTKAGGRVPMRVTTAPLFDAEGTVVGGVETFREVGGEYRDLERAKRIQAASLHHPEICDERLVVRDHYVPRDIVGGDFHAMARLSDDGAAFWVGDVMGHGISAALYTMQIRCLWDEYRALMRMPAAFVASLNQRLVALKGPEESFATLVFGSVDLAANRLTLVSAGGPAPLVYRAGDAIPQEAPLTGVPLGVVADMTYDELVVEFRPGDQLLLFTDGAFEAPTPEGVPLGRAGLIRLLNAAGYPSSGVTLADIEIALLTVSSVVRLPDDLTLMEVIRPPA